MTTDSRATYRLSVLSGRFESEEGRPLPSWCIRTRAARPILCLVIAFCLVNGLVPAPWGVSSARADQVEVRAALHQDHGRVVFQWPEPTGFKTRFNDRDLIIRFDRPFEGDVGRVRDKLPGYVSAVAVSGDHMSVTLTLTAPFEVRTSRYRTSVVLDLVPDTSALRARGRGVRVGVRVGEHDGFTRTVFDWKENVPYRVNERDGRIEISFDRAGAPDLGRFSHDPPRYILGATSRTGDGGVTVSLKVAPGTGMRHFRDGNRIVMDVLAGETPKADANARPTQNSAARFDPRPRTQASRPPPPRAQPRAAVQTRSIAEPKSEPGLAPEEVADTYRLHLEVSGLPTGIRIIFPWENPTPAAIFQRAGYMWAVFTRASHVDFSDLKPEFRDRLITAEQLPNRHATILRFKIPADRFVAVSRSELDWTVDVTTTPTLPPNPLGAERELDVHGGARIFVPVVGTGGRWDLRDPEVGDLMAVVPVLAPGYGFAEERLFTEFNLLPTAQGVVVQPLSERVDVDPRRNGVRIVSDGGLILSSDVRPPGRSESAVATADSDAMADSDAAAGPPDASIDATGQMVDFAAWSRGPERDYIKNLGELMRTLAQAPSGGRNTVRWELAHFFFAHNRTAEAIGILNVIASEDRTVDADPEFKFLRGALRLLLDRVDDAAKDLNDKTLDADPHAALWRSVLAAVQKDWPEAKRQYASGASVLKFYPPWLQARFRLAAAEAASMTNDITMLRVELHGIESDKLGEQQRTLAALYQGRLLEMEGDTKAAEEQYALVDKAGYRPNAVKAEFARLNLMAANGELSLEDQIKGLETLRYRWRGDDLELEVLQTLGRKYIEAGDPANGLQILRRAIMFFPDSVQAAGIAHEMNQAFRNLFLDGQADEMSEVSALALYYEFRELTPAGADGDQMIRKLSDRLVAVDLLGQATELLEHQVKYRLRGAEKAKVGARLARVYLLNRQPRKALLAIRISRYPRVGADIAAERRHVEARALTDLERHTEALRVLKGDTSDAAELIRADIYWGAKDWPRAAANIAQRLERNLARGKLLPADRFQVMRLAVALSLAGDRAGLGRVRERYNAIMAGTPDSAPFKILTSNIAHTDVNFRELAGKIASVSTLETFMSNVRDQTKSAEGQESAAGNAVN